jgi:hypothetical protein
MRSDQNRSELSDQNRTLRRIQMCKSRSRFANISQPTRQNAANDQIFINCDGYLLREDFHVIFKMKFVPKTNSVQVGTLKTQNQNLKQFEASSLIVIHFTLLKCCSEHLNSNVGPRYFTACPESRFFPRPSTNKNENF